jgi:hypothetical protein
MSSRSNTDFDSLIPELKDWNNGAGIDIGSWIGCAGNFELAIGYSTIFWPQFVEFEGYVLREGFSIESLRSFESGSCKGRRSSVEAAMNHLHVADIQHYGCEGANRERLVYLGRVLREIYTVKLSWQFPDRNFEVSFDDSNVDTLDGYQLTFFQPESPSST